MRDPDAVTRAAPHGPAWGSAGHAARGGSRAAAAPRARPANAALVAIAAAAIVAAPAVPAGRHQGNSEASEGSRPVTFAADVAPIVYRNCVVCHRPGQTAPFALLTYEDVKKRGRLIADVTARRNMPPWHATAAPGFPEFRDERRLTDAEIETIGAWVAAGMPPGDLARAPTPSVFPDTWVLGAPSVELTAPREIEVPADGPDLYRNVVIPLDLPDDRWITAIDFQPSSPRVVHHALFFLTPADESSAIGSEDAIPGLGTGLFGILRGRGLRSGGAARGRARGRLGEPGAGGIGGWVPGMTPRFFPPGIAQPLPAHTNIVVQLHLHPSGRPERERSRLALYFASQPPERSLMSIQVPPQFGFAMGIDIPAGERRYVVKDSLVLPVDVEAFGARGHAHYLAREMKMTAALPDGTTTGLLWIADWDFGWQDSYFYKAPFVLPAGTRLEVEIVYDNSSENPRNPNVPPQRVRWGLGSYDEMGSMTLLVAPSSPADRGALRQAQSQHFLAQLADRFFSRSRR